VLLATTDDVLGDAGVKRTTGAPQHVDEPCLTGRSRPAVLFRHQDKIPVFCPSGCPGEERRQEGPTAFDATLAERIRQGLAPRKNIDEKKMFGGIGILLNGNMLVGVWKDSLIVRLGPEEGQEALLEPHVKEFAVVGRLMKGWALVEPEDVVEGDRLKGWMSGGRNRTDPQRIDANDDLPGFMPWKDRPSAY
jgi:TfoX N-terminal domain